MQVAALAIIISAVFFGILGSRIAENKRVSTQWGFWLGLLLGPIGLVITALLNSSEYTDISGKRTEFSGDRELTNDAYKIWLVTEYKIEKNEALGSFVCDGRLFPSIDEAMQHAHAAERAAQSLAIEAEAGAEANRAAKAQAIEAEVRARQTEWKSRRERFFHRLRERRAAILGVALIVVVATLGAGGWALTRFVARANERHELLAEKAAAQAELSPIIARLVQAQESRDSAVNKLADRLLEAEIRKIRFRVKSGLVYHNVIITNGSKYRLDSIDGSLALYSGSTEIIKSAKCCPYLFNKEDRFGFDLGYALDPGESMEHINILSNHEVHVDDAYTRKMVADRNLRTYTNYVGWRHIVIDGAAFTGRAVFMDAPIRVEAEGTVTYTPVPINFRAIAESQLDLTALDRQIAALKPVYEERARALDRLEKRLRDH